jgi:DNA-directed RNA polymerase specialized sigma24 family protein
LKQEDFEKLLAWLHPNREQAGQKYETIRESLIKVFSWRGYNDAEDLADEVITRVAAKTRDLADSYVGDPALYFYGVAKNVVHECERREQHMLLDPRLKAPDTGTETGEVEAHARREECREASRPRSTTARRSPVSWAWAPTPCASRSSESADT